MRLAYYARCQSVDGTPQAERDAALIERLGYKAFPLGDDKKPIVADYLARKSRGEDNPMEAFRPAVEGCEAFFFRALPDGSIPAGVARELAWAQAAGIPVLELPNAILRRRLSVELTREYLQNVGQR